MRRMVLGIYSMKLGLKTIILSLILMASKENLYQPIPIYDAIYT